MDRQEQERLERRPIHTFLVQTAVGFRVCVNWSFIVTILSIGHLRSVQRFMKLKYCEQDKIME